VGQAEPFSLRLTYIRGRIAGATIVNVSKAEWHIEKRFEKKASYSCDVNSQSTLRGSTPERNREETTGAHDSSTSNGSGETQRSTERNQKETVSTDTSPLDKSHNLNAPEDETHGKAHKRETHKRATSKTEIPASQNTGLSVMLVNCRSVSRHKEAFDDEVDASKPDVILGTESWLSDKDLTSEIFSPDYVVYRKYRASGRGGGVFICIKNCFSSNLLFNRGSPALKMSCDSPAFG
jgi:hypothetical protein